MNKNKKVFILAITAALLCGCVANQPKLSSGLKNEYDTPIYCEGEEQCKLMWERAAYYVIRNAAYKLQIQSDTIIQTYNPMEHSVKLAYVITKEPLGVGKYQIWTNAWCDNMFGCRPSREVAIALAKRYIRTGKK
jgi:hypothetical protein